TLAAPAPISLEEALAEATLRAPDIGAAQARAAAAEAGVSAAGQLPPTALSVGGGRDDPQWSVGLTQRFPAFGARSARIDAAESEAIAAREDALQTIALARAQARRAFFALVRARSLEALADRTVVIAKGAEDA